MNPNTSYKITPFIRTQLAKPIGILFEGSIKKNVPKVKKWFKDNDIANPILNCVGDVVSNAFLSDNMLSRFLKMCIIDKKTKRGKYEIDSIVSDFKSIKISNPAGMITHSSIQTISINLASDSKFIIIVEGEEDLLVLPVILNSCENSFVVYGQPPVTDLDTAIPAGLVMIPVNSSVQKQVQDLLDQFEKV